MTSFKSKKYFLEENVGRIVGNWMILDREPSMDSSHGQQWYVRCSCGVVEKRRAYDLLNEKTTGCRSCCRSKHSNEYSFSSWYISAMQNKAAYRGIEWTITLDEIEDVWIKQNNKCALSGLPIAMGKLFKDNQTASLDRIDSSKGYISGNICWLDKRINKMKLDHSVEDFIYLCKQVASFKEIE